MYWMSSSVVDYKFVRQGFCLNELRDSNSNRISQSIQSNLVAQFINQQQKSSSRYISDPEMFY